MIAFSRRRIAALVMGAAVIVLVGADIAVRLTGGPETRASVPPAIADPSAPPPGPSSLPTPPATATATVSGPLTWSPADPGAEPGTTTGPATPTPSSARRAADGPQTASVDEMSQRRDPVPDGVAEQLSVYLGGEDPVCGGVKPGEAFSVTISEAREIPSVPLICVNGWGDNGDLSIELTTPTGAVLTGTRPGSRGGYEEIPFPLMPGSAPGVYRVRAGQGKDTATAEFRVRRATRPTIRVHPRYADAGTPVHVYLGGFPPGGRADLHFYAGDDNFALLYRTTRQVTVDAVGEAHLILETSTFTRPTRYLVLSPPVFDATKNPEVQFLQNLAFAIR